MPILTIILIVHDMQREAPRTLFSLGPHYQSGVREGDYRVIVVENRSGRLLGRDAVERQGKTFEYNLLDQTAPSPVAAVNFGVSRAETEFVAVIVDGARMVSPGLVAATLSAAKAFENPFIGTTAFHLGPKVQNISQLEGYNQAVEDRLLESAAWQENGYRLFDISVLAQSSSSGFRAGVPSECSFWAMKRSNFLDLGGFDDRFISPGGGLVNQDFANRVVESGLFNPVMILGEGTFHQFHGGVATGARPDRHPMHRFLEEYRGIRGQDYRQFQQPSVSYFGTLGSSARKFLLV